MSPPKIAAETEPATPSPGENNKTRHHFNNHEEQPQQQPPDENTNTDSLGEALAGLSVHSDGRSVHSQTSFTGSSALANAISAQTSGSSRLGGQPAAGQDTATWGNYATEGSNANSSYEYANGANNTTSSVFANNGATGETSGSLEHLLSLDPPSHTLGLNTSAEVFQLTATSGGGNSAAPAASNHQALPGLDSYQDTATNNGAHQDNAFGLASAPQASQPLSLAPGPAPRRRTDSPSGTGTTASSRSVSPYSSGTNGELNAAPPSGGRTIQAYPYATSYDAAALGSGSSTSDAPVSRNHSMLADDDRSSSGYNSLTHTHGSHPSLTALDQGKQPYSASMDRTNSSATFDRSVESATQQQQPQVLYMAVPSPDGRGQILQPVQMVQVPGKPYTYMMPGGSGSTAQQYHEEPVTGEYADGRTRPGYPAETTPSFARDEYGNSLNDPTMAYATPQRPPLETLLGQIRRLSRDQIGCRLVQQALDEEGPMAATLILNEGLSFWGEAMVDPFGNYLFQKILEKVTPEERVMLVKSISARLVNASLNLHGTRSVQKVVELCAQDEQSGATKGLPESAATVLTKSLAPAAARLCIDSHGNHVIQRILLMLGPPHSQFVFDAVARNVGDVARHRHGCCVIQRCLDSPSQSNPARAHLVARIVEKSLELMQDAYGNYVVQYVLDVCSDEDVHAVCESVVGKVNLLAIQKFSSNVMEKCLERCSDHVKEMYMAELSDPERIRELMMDPFGNYVVQRALSVATHAQAVRLVEAMRPHLMAQPALSPGVGAARNGGVRNTAGGRRIIAKICRRFPNFTLNPIGAEELYSQNHQKGNRHHRHHQPHQHHHHQTMLNRHPHPRSMHQQGHHQPLQQHYAAVGGPTNNGHQQQQHPLYARSAPMSTAPSYYSQPAAPSGYNNYDHFAPSGGGYPPPGL